MRRTVKRRYNFNSALYKIAPNAKLPGWLMGELEMSIKDVDGVVDCTIGRYSVKVFLLSDIVTEERLPALDELVDRTFRERMNDGLLEINKKIFPYLKQEGEDLEVTLVPENPREEEEEED